MTVIAGAMVKRTYRQVGANEALVIVSANGPARVRFNGSIVIPVLQRGELVDTSLHSIDLQLLGPRGVHCRDNIRADVQAAFFIRVNRTAEDVLRVAQTVGCGRASDPEHLRSLFEGRFEDALRTLFKELDFEDLSARREEVRDQIMSFIGRDLNGFCLEDVAIDRIEMTAAEHLDSGNILDAQGLRKIAEITASQDTRTRELTQEAERRRVQQEVEAAEAIAALDLQRAEAEARQRREIDLLRARELETTIQLLLETQARIQEAKPEGLDAELEALVSAREAELQALIDARKKELTEVQKD